MVAAVAVHEDGRTRRRDRNRWAVVDAVLGLVREGDLAPSATDVADRAGISARSVFRYFDDVDDLCRAAIARQVARVLPILTRPIDASAPRSERLAAAVAQRVELFETMGNVGVLARLRAPFQPLVADQLTQVRAGLRDLLDRALAPELAALAVDRARAALAAADVLCSFEAYQLLRHDHGLSRTEATAVLADGVAALLAGATSAVGSS